MGRPSSRLKLQALDVSDVADELLSLAIARLSEVAKVVGYDVAKVNTDGFWTACAELCRYAQVGGLSSTWKTPSPAALWAAFGPSIAHWPPLANLIDDAANARWHIYAGDRVSAKSLALLAGLDERHVRLLARRGNLTLGKTGVTAREAARWLASRGVPGFVTYKSPLTS